MVDMRWLRTEWVKPFPVERDDRYGGKIKVGVQMLRAVRSDGQMFEVHAEVEDVPFGIKVKQLRLALDAMLNDPALPPDIDEESGLPMTRQVYPETFKCMGTWVEDEEWDKWVEWMSTYTPSPDKWWLFSLFKDRIQEA